MSSVSHHPEDPSAGQGHRNSAGQAQKQTYDRPRPSQAMPLSAHQYYQQKRNESPPGEKKKKKKNNNNRRYLICPIHVCPRCLSRSSSDILLSRRPGQADSTLTSQAMSRFEQQPQNNLQPLDDRVTEYRKSSTSPGEGHESPNEHQSEMADRIKAWSDEWERLERR